MTGRPSPGFEQSAEPPSRTYLLAADDQGRQIVSVHVKRTYRLRPDGQCVRAEGEIPLLLGPRSEDDKESFDETDIVPFKGRTDLIVMSRAWGRGARQVLAKIRVGSREVGFHVSGERRVSYRGPGSISFGTPEPFDSIDMRYENAYGGFDPTVPDPNVVHLIDMMNLHPGEYPRNPVGKGYVVGGNRARIDGLALPNIEDPGQLLTPERLVVAHSRDWWRQPLPWSCDWFPKLAYPRIVHYRGVPDGLPDDDTLLPEVRNGWLEPGHARRAATASLDDPLDGRFADAASPALTFPFLRGDEAIELLSMTPDGRMVVRIPPDPPVVALRAKGKDERLAVVPHRILVSTIEMGVYVVWHAAWLVDGPLRRGPIRIGDTMASFLEDVEVRVDGERIAPIGTKLQP